MKVLERKKLKFRSFRVLVRCRGTYVPNKELCYFNIKKRIVFIAFINNDTYIIR